MNEKLTPLETWYLVKEYLNKFHHRIVSEDIEVETIEGHPINIIETALKDYEHSQQQRELYFKQAKELKGCYENELKNVSYYNNLALKYKKALEIIKEKEVDIGWLKRAKDLHEYNSGMGINSYSALNQEEYELLKEILK